MRAALAMVAVLCFGVACTAQKTTEKEAKVTRDEFGNSWPFTVLEGTLACQDGQEVVFTANSQTYAVNGLAASSEKYAEIHAIWADNPLAPGTRKDIGPILDRGTKLCG